MTFSEDKALFKLPYEMLPIPAKGQVVDCLDREGKTVAQGTVENVTEPKKDKTRVLHISAPKNLADSIRAVRVVC